MCKWGERGPRAWKTDKIGGLLLVAAVTVMVGIIVPAETRGQGGKGTAAGGKKADAKPEEMYGDQGGEKVLPANSKAPNTVMRARLEDTFLKLSNPRMGQAGTGKKGAKALLIDYEVVSR